MTHNTFKNRLKAMPLIQKLILIGSALMIIGVFLPWYKDIDRFRIGDTFLGITGPLYLAGFLVLVAAVTTFGLMFLRLLGKPLPRLPMREGHFYIAISGLSVLMLIMSASVFFHSKFGVNLTDKSMGMGMIFDFVGSGFVLLGALLSVRKKDVDFETEGHLEPLIDIDAAASGLERRPDPGAYPSVREREQVGDSVESHARSETRDRDTKVWGPVQESMNNYIDESKDERGEPGANTKDVRW